MSKYMSKCISKLTWICIQFIVLVLIPTLTQIIFETPCLKNSLVKCVITHIQHIPVIMPLAIPHSKI